MTIVGSSVPVGDDFKFLCGHFVPVGPHTRISLCVNVWVSSLFRPASFISKDTSDSFQIVMKMIYFLINSFLITLSDFSLVGNIIDHEVLP